VPDERKPQLPRVTSAAELRAAFDAAPPLTVGIEEEVMLLDPGTLDLAPRAQEVLDRLGGDPAFKLELPASQLEILTPPRPHVARAASDVAAGRLRLAEATSGLARPAAAGAHPFASPRGELNRGERYRRLAAEYGEAARRQLVCAVQVHVAVGDADRTLAVYNGLRGHLPDIAALAAAAPFHDGLDTGLASVRPMVSSLLPRQGVPPPIPAWDDFAAELEWGAKAGGVPEPRRWWWELRPNPAFGTLEVRVPDAQATVADVTAVAAFVHALVGRLCEWHAEGRDLPVPPSWRIAENRWSACRDGVEGTMADLGSGRRTPTRERLSALLDEIRPAAERLRCERELDDARRLVVENGAMRQRAIGRRHGPVAVARWLADRFCEGVDPAAAGDGEGSAETPKTGSPRP
jgi:glutamate---cysteine ligase / carboxylate-amine ligase